MRNLRKILPWLFVILWMIIIFYLSHQQVEQSNNLSKELTDVIIKAVEKIAPEKNFKLGNFNHIIRKNAHFFSYLILGVLVAYGLGSNGLRGYRGIGLALLICVLYAISDEAHQLFVPGRGGQVKDVILDSAGAIVGIAIYKWLCRYAFYTKLS